jgi:hypothetical protein
VEIQADLRAVACFFDEEAVLLARARTATGYAAYPVPQAERDPLFVLARARGRLEAAMPAPGPAAG